MNTHQTHQHWESQGYITLRGVLGLGKNSQSRRLFVGLNELNILKRSGIDAKARLVASRKNGGLGSTATAAVGMLYVPTSEANKAAVILRMTTPQQRG